MCACVCEYQKRGGGHDEKKLRGNCITEKDGRQYR